MPAPVRKSLRVDAPPRAAFKVFTAGIGLWWPKSHHIGTADPETFVIEPRKGGRWYERGVDGSECEVGKVWSGSRPRASCCAGSCPPISSSIPALITEVEVRFIREGETATRVELEHRNLERLGDRADAMRQQIDAPKDGAACCNCSPNPSRKRRLRNMNDIVVYGVPGSPFVRASRWGWRRRPLPIGCRRSARTSERARPISRGIRSAACRLSSTATSALYETQAILRYLDDMFPEPRFVPADPRAAARMNQIVGINDWYFFPKVAAVVVFQRIIGPVLLGMPTDETAVAGAVPMARTCIAELDRLLGAQRFLAGDQLTIADIMLAPQIDFLGGDAGRQGPARRHRPETLARPHECPAEHDRDLASGAAARRCLIAVRRRRCR